MRTYCSATSHPGAKRTLPIRRCLQKTGDLFKRASGSNQTLFFGHSGHPHGFTKALPIKKKNRIFARCIETEAADCEGRLERQSCLRGGPRLIQLADKCESGGEMEVG